MRMLQCKEDKQQEKDKEVRSDRGREQGQERAEEYQNALQMEKWNKLGDIKEKEKKGHKDIK